MVQIYNPNVVGITKISLLINDIVVEFVLLIDNLRSFLTCSELK